MWIMVDKQTFLFIPFPLQFSRLQQHRHLVSPEHGILLNVRSLRLRKDNTSVFKANPRRHEFVVFNVPRGTEVDIVKQYIASNNVDVMDIVRLSKDDWPNQSFRVCCSYDHIEKVKVSDF